MRHEPTIASIGTIRTAAAPAGNRREGIAFVVILLATLALFGHLIWSGYRDTQREAEVAVGNLADVIEHDLRFTLEHANSELKAAAAVFAERATGGRADWLPVMKSVELRMIAMTETGLGRFAVVEPDGGGWVLQDPATGETAPAGRVITEQIDFAAGEDLMVAVPVRRPAGGGPPMLVYRLMRDEAGTVQGAVALLLHTGQLERLLQDVDLGEHGAIVLRRVDDNALLLRRPPWRSLGASSQTTPPYERIARGEHAGVARFVSPLDGVERVYGFRRVGGYPLYVAVGLAAREYLAPWLHRALLAGTAAAVLLVSLAWMMRRRLRSEALLRESTLALQEAESVGGLGHWEADAATGSVRWSPHMYCLLGIDPSTPASREAFDAIVHSADRAQVHEAWRQAAQEGAFDVEHRIIVSGEIRWVRARARTVKDESGVPVRAVGTMLDVTARRTAEEALAAERNLLRTILNAIPDFVFLKDETGVYRLCNLAVERYFGRPEQEILGRTDFELVDAETAARFRRDDMAAIASSDPTRREEKLAYPDGSRLYTETIKLPMRDPDGRLLGLLGVARDVTVRKLAEQSLIESEQKYRSLLDEMADGVYVAQDYRLVLANKALASLLGYGREDLIGMPLTEMIAPDFRDLVIQRYEQRVGGGEQPPRRYEIRLSRRDGTEVWAELIASRMLFNGRPSALVIVRDNTERRHAEQFLRDVIESTSDGILVEDRNGRALVTNHCFLEMWNIPSAALQSAEEHALHAYVQAQLAGNAELPAKTADLRSQDQWRDYHLLQVGDGRLIARYSSPLLRDGVVAGRVWSFRDVTERRKTEILYRSVIESSPDAFVAVDEDGRIVDWSPRAEQLFGWPAGEVMGGYLHETMIPPAYRDLHVQGMRRFMRSGESRVMGRVLRMTALRKGGQEFPVELQVSAVRIGSRWRFTSFIRDISSRVLAEQQLAQAQRMEAIGQLTGGLAHDFNNMLGIIIGSLDLLSLEQTDAEARELISTAMSAAHRGVEVTKSLLAVARRQALAPKIVEVDAALTEMGPLLRQTAGKRVEVRLEPGVPGVRAYLDPGSFNNAVLNTVINARDAMPAGGELRISTALVNAGDTHLAADLDPGTYIEVRVEDTGCGMPPEVVERAFDPFFTSKERGKGTGLGLAMVYGFARQSGGTATISSTVGVGTCVKLVLPVAATPVRKEEGAAAPGDRPTARTGESVLVVDDEFDLRKIIREWLVAAGYRVALADSPAEALSRMQAERFDLMLTDVVMPGPMDGAALARTVAQRHPATRVLLMSGYADDALDGVKQQWRVLEKPFRQDELARAVRRELDERDALPA